MCGIVSNVIQCRLLVEAECVMLQKAIDIFHAMEAADGNLQTLQDLQHTQVMDRHVNVHIIAQPT